MSNAKNAGEHGGRTDCCRPTLSRGPAFSPSPTQCNTCTPLMSRQGDRVSGARPGNGLMGRHILDALARADDLTPKPLEEESDPRKIFSIDGVEGLRTTFKTLLSDASVQVTSALAVADEIGATP